jgi:hypothetical protein
VAPWLASAGRGSTTVHRLLCTRGANSASPWRQIVPFFFFSVLVGLHRTERSLMLALLAALEGFAPLASGRSSLPDSPLSPITLQSSPSWEPRGGRRRASILRSGGQYLQWISWEASLYAAASGGTVTVQTRVGLAFYKYRSVLLICLSFLSLLFRGSLQISKPPTPFPIACLHLQ